MFFIRIIRIIRIIRSVVSLHFCWGLLFSLNLIGCMAQTSTPEGFIAKAGDTKIILTWNMQKNTTYTLYWSLTSGVGTEGTQLSSSITSPYTHMGLMNGTQYYYVLTASNDLSTSPPTAEVSAIPTKIISSSGTSFTGASGHSTSGEVFVSFVNGKRSINFVNFTTDSGPNLNVYLSTSLTVTVDNFIDLGDLKKVTGEQSYEIPSDTDLSKYNKVLIWCVDFSVSFGSADVAALPPDYLTPEGFVAKAGYTKIILTWNMQENTTYTLYWSLTSGVGTEGTQLSSPITSPYTHLGLTNGTPYYYVLTASNDLGTSPPTAEVSAIPAKIISSSRTSFTGASGHSTSGEVFVSFVDGKRSINFVNFTTDSGPDLNVYLSTSLTMPLDDFVDLGDLKKVTGEQSYEILNSTDLSKYNKVLIWCVDFSVLFGSADLVALPAN